MTKACPVFPLYWFFHVIETRIRLFWRTTDVAALGRARTLSDAVREVSSRAAARDNVGKTRASARAKPLAILVILGTDFMAPSGWEVSWRLPLHRAGERGG
jgi:hypothetical protein